MSKLKRVLAINDVSCVGRCSLTVALPIISGAGIECSVLPTAVLSTHTGGFSGYTVKDLDDQILPIANHWIKENISFDCMMSGYLASSGQIDKIKEVFKMFKNEKNIIIVDPTMADNGKLYPAFDDHFPKEMAKLVSISDICIPNITEACLLAGIEYKEGVNTKEYYESLLVALHLLGAKNVVLTGVSLNFGMIGVAVLENGNVSYYQEEKVPYSFHGTGDVYGACFASAIVSGFSIFDSAKIASNITKKAILETISSSTDSKFGVNFECIINDLYVRLRGESE